MKTKTKLTPEQEASWKKYKIECAACTCLSDERKGYIESAMDFAEDFSDGAFMAYMEECGIDVSELECFSTTHYAENHARAEGER